MTKEKTTKLAIIVMMTLILASFIFAEDLNPPIIISSSPHSIQNSRSIYMNITTNENAYCKYAGTDIIYANMISDFTLLNTTSTYVNIALTNDSSYSFYIRCKDEANNEMTSSELVQFEIDSTVPTIISKTPVGTVDGQRIILNITTNEDTTCHYDLTSKSFDQMTYSFDTNGKINHEKEILHLGEGQKTYYIACQDKAKNTVTNTITFNTGLAVSAGITLSKSPPLTKGTYEVTITTTKNLASAPNLYYKFDDDNSPRTVSLVGQDKTWKGYLVIAESNLDRVGKFYFTGTDFDGISGTKITSSELFLIDTTDPPKVTSITSYEDDNDIKITWFYEGEEKEKFNIYRSTKSGVQYTDYYDKSTDQKYLDTDVETGTEYFYRIAVIDKAGKTGELSEETHTITDGVKIENNTITEEKLSKTLQIELNSTVKRIKNDILNVESSISSLEKTTDPQKSKIISSKNLIEKAKNAKTSIQETITQLNLLLDQDLSEIELKDRIDTAITNVQNAKKEVAQKIEVKDSLSFKQSASESDIDTAINEVALRNDMTDEEIQVYKKNSTTLFEKTEI